VPILRRGIGLQNLDQRFFHKTPLNASNHPSRAEETVSKLALAGFQPLISFATFSWGVAPGWYGSRLRRFKPIIIQYLKRRRRVLYQPRAKP